MLQLPLLRCWRRRAGSTAWAEAAGLAGLEQAFAAIEVESGGRLGVAVLTGSGASAGYRAEERFPLCSTFKALAAAAILVRVDARTEQLERRIPVAQADILTYAPVAKRHVGGEMTIADLCAAAVTVSDARRPARHHHPCRHGARHAGPFERLHPERGIA